MRTQPTKSESSQSLTTTLAIAFFVLSVVVLLIANGLQVLASLTTQQQVITSRLQLIAQAASQPVSSFISDKFRVLETVASRDNLPAKSPTEQQQILDGALGQDEAFRQLLMLNAQDQLTAQASRLSSALSSRSVDLLSDELLAQVKQGKQYISSVYIDPNTNEPLIFVAIPAVDAFGDFQGTLAAEVNLKFMWNLVDQLKVGEGGLAYVVDGRGNLIAFNDTARVLRGENLQNLSKVKQFVRDPSATTAGAPEASTGILGTTTVGAYAPLGTPPWAVMTELPWEEAYRDVIRQTLASIAITIVIATLAGMAGAYLARRLAKPVVSLTDTAARIADGEITLRAAVAGPREVASLATAFNSMTAQLRSLIGSLEERVQARTEQLRASADVGRTAASVLEQDELLRRVVNLISDRFGFYYAAVFVIDRSGQYAVLREATGEAGHILKERGHQLEVNGQSMVGYAITRRHSRIALDVGEDAVRFANPLLPDTRSEIALPLIVGDRVLGALDVQSTEEAAFDEASAAVLQSMADQIAIAWNNALSYAETEEGARRARALFAASREVGHLQTDLAETIRATLRAAAEMLDYDRWCVLTFNEIQTALLPIATHNWPEADAALDLETHRDHPLIICLQQDTELFVTGASATPLPIEDLRSLIGVPIKTRDTIVGVLAFSRTHGRELAEGDLEVGRSLANLIAVAIENHNLVETSRRTLRELDEINRTLTGQSWERFVRRQEKREIIWVSRSDRLQPNQTQLPEVSEALRHGHIATRMLDDEQQLGVAVPIKLRDVPVGALRLIVPRRTWNLELAAALDSIAGHVAQAAENARLIAQTEERLLRERALADATEKVRQRSEIEAVLHTAATELARYLNASHITVRMAAQSEPADGNGEMA